jgi:hypothetical protein
LSKRFQRIIFYRNQPIRSKNCLWQPCLFTVRDELSDLYRGPAKEASYHVLVHLAKCFQRGRFLKIDPLGRFKMLTLKQPYFISLVSHPLASVVR